LAESRHHVLSAAVNQMQSIAKMQIEMMDHTLEVWREQIGAGRV